MTTTHDTQRTDVLVIGAGQAGLAAGYHLRRHGIDQRILEADPRVGDVWRRRYDSLTLYSPARSDELPGMRFPLPKREFPTGRQMGDYLETYAGHFGLPVDTGVRVERLEAPASDGEPFVVTAGERRYEASQVIVATGAFQRPTVPAFAADLDPSIRQLHSSAYRNPSQLADGPVLVVGLSHSGADLAHEIAATHPVIISGRAHGQLPFSVDSRRGKAAWPVLAWVFSNVMTLDTPIGRKMAPEVRTNGGLLLRWRRPELLARGVELTDARTTGVRDGKPLLADGRVIDVANVLWCTGFGRDYSWITPAIELDEQGWPVQYRGVTATPGLYFMGLIFQYSFTSMLIHGAGRDAGYVADHIAGRLREPYGASSGARTTKENSRDRQAA
jgi:putative flavoprotein involved in K+ transport